MNKCWAGSHLNVAVPIWQGFTGVDSDAIKNAVGGRLFFQQHLTSSNENIRKWAKSARDSFNNIRNTPDPILRNYYKALHLKRRLKAKETVEKRRLESSKEYLTGKTAIVKVGHNGECTEVSCGIFRFSISSFLRLDLKQGDEVFCQFHLSEHPHPYAYTKTAEPRDPASRLAISIKETDSHGDFHVWLMTKGQKNVFKINSLVDLLDGYTTDESRAFGRRWYVRRAPDRSRTHVYTE